MKPLSNSTFGNRSVVREAAQVEPLTVSPRIGFGFAHLYHVMPDVAINLCVPKTAVC